MKWCTECGAEVGTPHIPDCAFDVPEKKSTAGAVSEKAQAAAVRRDVVRKHVAALATEIMNQLDFENSTVPDEPEGMVQIHVHMSKTLAEDMLKSLRAAEVML